MPDIREWGSMAMIRGPYDLDQEVIDRVRQTLIVDHAYHRKNNAEVPELGNGWFRTGPVTPAYTSDPCPVPQEADHEDCPVCHGAGEINVVYIPDKWDHSFAWYAVSGLLSEGSVYYE